MVAKLTDRANVQALDRSARQPAPHAPAVRGVQEATTTLLEPIFLAKSIKNQAFLTVYYRILKDELTPLLKNHLIPRVQAMIILGECGSADFLPLYIAQIKDPTQTVWVKLWALEGLVNVVEEGGRLTAQDQILAAKTVADFLEKEIDLPWPAQLRALEVLSAMRQGYEPNKPQKADHGQRGHGLAGRRRPPSWKSDPKRRGPWDRCRSPPRSPSTTIQLIAHAAGQLAAELGNRIATGFTSNQDKAKYLTALLIGPVYQAFDGVPGARDSGLLHATGGPSAAYIQKVFDLVKPVAQATIELLSAGQRQVKERQKELVAHVAALKDFLEKNASARPPPGARRSGISDRAVAGRRARAPLPPHWPDSQTSNDRTTTSRCSGRDASLLGFPDTARDDRQTPAAFVAPLDRAGLAGPRASGCSEELGPERMVVTRVKGVVRDGRSPVSAGWIEFFPVEGRSANSVPPGFTTTGRSRPSMWRWAST